MAFSAGITVLHFFCLLQKGVEVERRELVIIIEMGFLLLVLGLSLKDQGGGDMESWKK